MRKKLIMPVIQLNAVLFLYMQNRKLQFHFWISNSYIHVNISIVPHNRCSHLVARFFLNYFVPLFYNYQKKGIYYWKLSPIMIHK